MHAARRKRVAWLTVFAIGTMHTASAQERSTRPSRPEIRSGSRVLQTATIHWQKVPLRDAVGRMRPLFDEAVFVDRRIDPNTRISLDMTATGTAQVVTEIAAKHGWGPSRVGGVAYLGPDKVARVLGRVIDARKAEVAKLPAEERTIFERKRPLKWPRLTEPRELVTELIEKNGWRVADAERIPHDLWSAGELTQLTLVEQLTLLLVGFNLTFEIQPAEQTIRIVNFPDLGGIASASKGPSRQTKEPPQEVPGTTKQVYSLRVAEKPVGAVARELAKQLNWQIEFDEAAIQAAGRSLDARVTLAVENVEQEELLDAVLRPAGLTFRRDGERIMVGPR